MKKQRIFQFAFVFVLVAFVAVSLSGFCEASDTKMPKVMNIIGHRLGSKSYGLVAGFAKIGSAYLPTEIKAVPTAGPAEWVPMAYNDEVDMAWVNAFDGMEAYYGVGFFEGKPSNNMMVLLRGGSMRVGVLTRKDANIKQWSDLKGKKFCLYSAGRAFTIMSLGFLNQAGLSRDDVKVVTVPGPAGGVKALIEGRADAVGTAEVTMGAIAELEAGRGGVYLSFDPSKETAEKIHEFFPVGKSVLVEPGPGVRGLGGPTYLWTFDWYILASKNLSDDIVYQLAKTYWEHDSELWPIHAGLRESKKETFVVDDASLPYHPGAIKLYKERSAWTAGAQEQQEKLLSKQK